MNDKYKLTENTKTIDDRILYQIEALKDFQDISKGDLGGWIEAEKNLSVYGDAWVSGNARVYGNAIFWISKIGSENGTLTAFLDKDEKLCVTRSCFYGTIEKFKEAVEETHGDSELGLEYKAAIALVELRAKRFTVQGRVR